MANNTRGPRGRSRKPRPRPGASPDAGGERGTPSSAHGAGGEAEAGTAGAPRGSERRANRTAARRGGAGRVPAYRDFDERPQAPWHPLPLSELLILAGAIAFVVALVRLGHHGVASGAPLLLAGVLALGLGTAEVSWREHRAGFRSHTLLLAFIPVLALHTTVVVGYSALASPSRALNIGMFVVDVAVFALLVRYLRARFQIARARR